MSKHRLRAVLVVSLAIAAGVGVAVGSAGAMPVAPAAAGATSTAPATPTAPTASHASASTVSAAGAPGAASGHLVSVKLGLKPPVKPVLSPAVAYDTCPTVRAHLKQDTANGKKAAICVTSTPTVAPSNAPAPARVGARAVPAVSSACPAPGGQWVVRTRYDDCSLQGWIFTAMDLNGKNIGQATFLINQDMILAESSEFFVENDTITYSNATGFFTMLQPGFPGYAQFFPSCTAPCQVVSVPGEFPMTPSEVESFPVTFETPTGVGAVVNTSVSYQMTFMIPDAISDNVARWNNPAPIRCDNDVAPGATTVGCVFPGYTPTLVVPASVYGTAAVNIAVGETFLRGNPGYLTPLHRGDTADRQGNMDAVCDSTFFHNTLLVPNDSCDEYPFASSLESGGQLSLTGVNCLETVPQIVNGVWKVWFLTAPVGQQCERGHVPNDQNTAVGGPLSVLYSANRMLIGDAYFVQATP
jgi:hypothetical protein